MKTFCKTKLMPFLLVAITALCALFGVIFTTPLATQADEIKSQGVVEEILPNTDYNLYGKYLVFPYVDDGEQLYGPFSIGGYLFDYQGGILTALCDQYNGQMLLCLNPFELKGGYYTLPNGDVVDCCVYDFTQDITLDVEASDIETNEVSHFDIVFNEETAVFYLWGEDFKAYIYTPGSEVPEDSTDQEQEAEKPGFTFDGVADWFDGVGADISELLQDNGVNVDGRSVLVAGFAIVVIVLIFRKKRH